MWFETLMGFNEESPEQVRTNLIVDGNTMRSKVNDKIWGCGQLETPSLADLRTRTQARHSAKGHLTLREVVGDVQQIHIDAASAGALFQVASQFNLLEMVGPTVTPEEGVGIYEYDHTQGPACAIAAGAGTIYRNYFAPVNGQIGQSAHNQIDCLQDFGYALGNRDQQLWTMQNGYALPSKEGLVEISKRLGAMTDAERDTLRATLRIGVHWDVQVTLADCEHTVTQTYCSALPVAYSSLSSDLWSDFAQLVLDASYEATFHAALLNYANTGNNQLYLTLLGGGAFGNAESWIFAAIQRAIELFREMPLDVAIVSYGQSDPNVRRFIAQAGF